MDAFFPELLVIVDLMGFGLTLWLGLHLVTSTWGWQPGRARAAALALWSLTFFFALGTYDNLESLAGANLEKGLLRLLLLPLPIFWVFLAQRLAPAVLRVRLRLAFAFVLAAAFLACGANLMTGYLRPDQINYSWIYLPTYLIALLLGMLVTLSLVWRSRGVVISTRERRVIGLLGIASLVTFVGATLLATDFVFGLGSAYLADLPLGEPDQTRLVASGFLLLASLLLSLLIILQARADGATHISNLAHSFLVTVVMTLLYMGLGGSAIVYWELPLGLLALFLFLALTTDWLDNATHALLARGLYRGTTGKLLHDMRVAAANIENPEKLPPPIRPLLSHLARQLNSPQLGLALPEGEQQKKEYRIVAALRPSWEGQTLDVKDGTTWEERGVGGWNMPLRHNNQTIGIIASDRTGPLNDVQKKLLQNTATHMAQIMTEWEALKREQETLQKTLEQYRRRVHTLDAKSMALATPTTTTGDMRRAVAKLLKHYNDSATIISKLPLAKLKLIENLLPSGVTGPENRAQAVKKLIAELVEQLRPMEGEIPTDPTPEWYPYLVASRLHLQGQPEDEFLIRHKMKKRAMKKARQTVIDSLARMVAELETGLIQQEEVQKAVEKAAAAVRPATATPSRSPATPGTSPAATGRGTAATGRSPAATGRTPTATGSSPTHSRPYSSPGARPGTTSPASQSASTQKQGVLARLKARFLPGKSAPGTQQSPTGPARGMPAAQGSKGDKKRGFGQILSSLRRSSHSTGQPAGTPGGGKGGLSGKLSRFTARFSRKKETKQQGAPGGAPLFPRLPAQGSTPKSAPSPGSGQPSHPAPRPPGQGAPQAGGTRASSPGQAPAPGGGRPAQPYGQPPGQAGGPQATPGGQPGTGAAQPPTGPAPNVSPGNQSEKGEGETSRQQGEAGQSSSNQTQDAPSFYRD